MASKEVTLKLLIDTKNKKVLFAEASKDFVDFLFNLLARPVGSVIRLLSKHGKVGSLSNLYNSIENLNETYFQPNQNKDVLLKPQAPFSASRVPLLISDDESFSRKLYMCRNYHQNVADDPRAVCAVGGCKRFMDVEVPYVTPNATKGEGSNCGGGFVKGLVTYMVMDDLVVEPMSTISSITLLNKFNVKEVGVLQEKVVTFGMAEGLELLQASLQTKSVLSTVFRVKMV